MGPAVTYLQLGAVWKMDVTNLQKLKRKEYYTFFFFLAAFGMKFQSIELLLLIPCLFSK